MIERVETKRQQAVSCHHTCHRASDCLVHDKSPSPGKGSAAVTVAVGRGGAWRGGAWRGGEWRASMWGMRQLVGKL